MDYGLATVLYAHRQLRPANRLFNDPLNELCVLSSAPILYHGGGRNWSEVVTWEGFGNELLDWLFWQSSLVVRTTESYSVCRGFNSLPCHTILQAVTSSYNTRSHSELET